MTMRMKRVYAIAGGDVQAVGYRELVRKATLKRIITGFVRNLESGEVEIVAEGSQEDIEKFLEEIQINEYPIDVRNFQVPWLDASGEFRRFEIIRGDKDQELFERIDVIGTLLYKNFG
jgi:acylphosphatase